MSVNQPPPPPPGGTPPRRRAGTADRRPGWTRRAAPAGPPSSGWDLGAAVSYGWNKLQTNLAQIILAAIALVAAVAVVAILGTVVIAALTDWNTPFFVRMVLNAALFGVVFVIAQVLGAGIIRGALGITEGRAFEAAEVFRFENVGKVLLTALIIGGASAVGYMLCYLPGIVITFLTSYALYFVIDKQMEPIDAIRASFELIKDNLGDTIIWYIVGGLIAAAGAILCLIGALFTFPLTLIGTAYTYKVLTRQPVAP
ncbi:hypothetical protein [Nocardioides sambongensis]|uniref:hypothetical protein n=1 Tax=Nocardioides sambongensis TaxID=2589074 RepID=UPI00112C4024|nr:hypothetical protein [Nocardioides sambongensis]